MPDNSRRTHDGKWRKGVSGNPSGPQPGYRHKSTQFAQKLLDGECKALIRKLIEMAMDGDATAMRLAVERLVPPRRERPVDVELPKLTSAADAAQAVAALVAGVADGELTPTEGRAIGTLVDLFTRANEVELLAVRLEAVEQALKARS